MQAATRPVLEYFQLVIFLDLINVPGNATRGTKNAPMTPRAAAQQAHDVAELDIVPTQMKFVVLTAGPVLPVITAVGPIIALPRVLSAAAMGSTACLAISV